MILQNSRVLVEFSDNTGALLRLQDKKTGMDYINSIPNAACRVIARFHKVQMGKDVYLEPRELLGKGAIVEKLENVANISWNLGHGIRLSAHISLLEDGLSFCSTAECDDKSEITLVEYPIIGGMGNWNGCTELAHSFATGLKVKNPLVNFKSGEGIRYAPYPESFSGASMQFFSYYAPGVGGLLFMAADGESHQKWLNFYRNENAMEATMMYGMENMGPGKKVAAQYPFEIRFLQGNGWWEGAQIYKNWAINQKWCSMGKTSDRTHCDWLLKEIGMATFGIDASYDRSVYIRRYHQDVNTKVFHILGPDWASSGQSFGMGNPGYSLDGWVPASIHNANVDAIREIGDRFAPFEFDLFGHARPDENDEIKKKAEANRQIFPKRKTFSCDAYDFFMMCPCEKHTQEMHVERDRIVVSQTGADAMYYDISANNLLHVCLQQNHNHPKGGGNVLTQNYRMIYQKTKSACADAVGKDFFPIGTEMINEVFLPVLDFYQARAGAQPCSSLEMWPYKELINEGKAELIPMFAYVYHEYGAVRMDGWGKCVEEVGDLFYDTVAKIYEWGGLYELNHEYSPGEAIDGVETSVEEHYWEGFSEFGYEYSQSRAHYIRQFADMRTGRANRYLAYGKMMKPPCVSDAVATKHYYHYNHGVSEIFEGDILLPAVRAAAWESVDPAPKGYAIIMTNTTLERGKKVKIEINATDYPGARIVKLIKGFGTNELEEQLLGMLEGEESKLVIELALPSRQPVMLELC